MPWAAGANTKRQRDTAIPCAAAIGQAGNHGGYAGAHFRGAAYNGPVEGQGLPGGMLLIDELDWLDQLTSACTHLITAAAVCTHSYAESKLAEFGFCPTLVWVKKFELHT